MLKLPQNENFINEFLVLVKIYLDNEFKLEHECELKFTIPELKILLCEKYELFSINYLMSYNNKDITDETKSIKEVCFIGDILEKEIRIDLTSLNKMVEERDQRVIITYQEGTMFFIVYKMLTNEFVKVVPIVDDDVPLKILPYKSRYCNISNQNKIFISGGIDQEQTFCFYDYDLNRVIKLPDMTYKKLGHSMVVLKDEVFVVGGNSCYGAEVFHTEFEDWTRLPDLNYDRQDPGVCIINEKMLYVFMGNSSNEGKIMKNFERLNLDEREKWKLLSVFNPIDLNGITHCCAIFPYNEGVIILGGFTGGSCVDTVTFFHLESYIMSRIDLRLPESTAFIEKTFYTLDNIDFYLFTYGSYKLLNFNFLNFKIKEVTKEV